ncbi:MAG: hypothetical protein ACRDD8_06385 [Bacteroidales bacterium]
MATGNFSFENRCIVVTNEDYAHDNLPELGDYYKGSNRSYPSTELLDQPYRLLTLVLTSGYYEGACVDFLERDDISFKDLCGLCDWHAYESVSGYIDDLITNGAHILKEFGISEYKIRKTFSGIRKYSGNIYSFIEEKETELFELLISIEKDAANKYLDDLRDQYGYEEYGVFAKFSNGETMYSKIA